MRDVCLQECGTDTDCALGERCITETGARGQEARVCIKICFYDAHCLAGEYCEDNVCRPGCRSDSNCPFGQICGRGPEEAIRECEDGCHFSNDCPIDRVRYKEIRLYGGGPIPSLFNLKLISNLCPKFKGSQRQEFCHLCHHNSENNRTQEILR